MKQSKSTMDLFSFSIMDNNLIVSGPVYGQLYGQLLLWLPY